MSGGSGLPRSRPHALQPQFPAIELRCNTMLGKTLYEADLASSDRHSFHLARTARVSSPCVRAFPSYRLPGDHAEL